MIASHNRRNLDTYLLAAIREELRVATLQLASLQAAVAALLQDFAQLRGDIEDLLQKQSVHDALRNIRVANEMYLSEINTRSQYRSDKDWFNSSRREQRLNQILDDLIKSRFTLLESTEPLDPSSAIVLASAALTEITLMNVCNTNRQIYDRIKFLDTIGQYESYFALVKKDNVSGSTAWYRAQHIASRLQTFKWFELTPVWKELGRPTDWVNNCAQWFQAVSRAGFGNDFGGRLNQRVSYEDISAFDEPAVKTRLNALNIPEPPKHIALPFRRLKYAPGFSAEDAEYENVLYGWNGELLDYQEKPTRWKYGDATPCVQITDAQFPKDPLWRWTNWKDKDYEDAIKQSSAWRRLVARTSELEQQIDKLNLDSAKILYADEALRAVDDTLPYLAAIRRSFR
jgi:hypothetical protein